MRVVCNIEIGLLSLSLVLAISYNFLPLLIELEKSLGHRLTVKSCGIPWQNRPTVATPQKMRIVAICYCY